MRLARRDHAGGDMVTEPTLFPPSISDGGPCDKFAEALAAFQAEAPTVPKNKTANTGSYSYAYADLADITEVAYPILARHGLAFSSAPQGEYLVGKLMHKSGQWDRGAIKITGQNMQQIGSAITYGRRYLFGSLTGIVTDADDDGQAASKPKPAKKAAARPARQQQPERAVNEPVETGELRTDAQSRHMFALLNEAGLGERDAARAHIAKIIGHNIESTKDLTKAEAHKVIEALKAAAKPAPENYGGEDPWAPR